MSIYKLLKLRICGIECRVKASLYSKKIKNKKIERKKSKRLSFLYYL